MMEMQEETGIQLIFQFWYAWMVGWIGCLSAKASYMSTGQKARAVKHVT